MEHDRRTELLQTCLRMDEDRPQPMYERTKQLGRTNGTISSKRQEIETTKEIYRLVSLYITIYINYISSYHVFVAEFMVKCKPKWCLNLQNVRLFSTWKIAELPFQPSAFGFQTDPLRISSSLWSERRTKHPDLQRIVGLFGFSPIQETSNNFIVFMIFTLHKNLWNEMFN